MSPATTTQRMTADEFAEWVVRPENGAKHWELVRGEVIEMSRPGERHGFVCMRIGMKLMLYAEQQGRGYSVSNDPGIVLERDPDTVRGPDLIYFDKTKPYDELNPKWIEEPPVLAVEVLSPNDRPNKITARVGEFLRSGIRLVWVVDPESREIAVHRADRPPVILEGEQEITGDDVLPGFRCRIQEFFQVPGQVKPKQEGQGQSS